jgi:hypothetical protein
MFVKKVMRRIYEHKEEKNEPDGGNCIMRTFIICRPSYYPINGVRVIKSI